MEVTDKAVHELHGEAMVIDGLIIAKWERQVFEDVEMEQLLVVREGESTAEQTSFEAFALSGGGAVPMSTHHSGDTP